MIKHFCDTCKEEMGTRFMIRIKREPMGMDPAINIEVCSIDCAILMLRRIESKEKYGF